MDYLRYITQSNDRWDNIAYRFYGSATNYRPIIDANPDVMLLPILPEGTLLKIPVIEAQTIVSNENLPPWKRK